MPKSKSRRLVVGGPFRRGLKMGRFFNREAGVVALVLLLAGVAAAIAMDASLWIRLAVGVGPLVVLHWFVTPLAQEKLLEFYTESFRYESALRLAMDIRESSMDRQSRQSADLNVAFVQMACGHYDMALKRLRTIITTKEQPITKSIVEGITGYCMAYLGKDLDEAEKLISSSLEAQPKEGMFVTFLALLRLRQGRFEEAKLLLEKSMELDSDPELPHAGERPYLMAHALSGMGELARAQELLNQVAEGNPKSHFTILAKQGLDRRLMGNAAPKAEEPKAEQTEQKELAAAPSEANALPAAATDAEKADAKADGEKSGEAPSSSPS